MLEIIQISLSFSKRSGSPVLRDFHAKIRLPGLLGLNFRSALLPVAWEVQEPGHGDACGENQSSETLIRAPSPKRRPRFVQRQNACSKVCSFLLRDLESSLVNSQ